MSKDAERDYLKRAGEAGRSHSLNKPFSDDYCGFNLASIGVIMTLLPPPPARVLDMGCGGGWASIFLAKRGYQVLGRDISEDMIALARENAEAQGVGDRARFLVADFETPPDECGAFDAAIFFDCLHHAQDERAALACAHAALKPGGLLIAHEPGEGHATAPGSIAAMEEYGVSERDMPPHLIIRQARALGFRTARVLPMPQEVIEQIYLREKPPRWSKAGLLLARRVWRFAFRPSVRASAITVLTK